MIMSQCSRMFFFLKWSIFIYIERNLDILNLGLYVDFVGSCQLKINRSIRQSLKGKTVKIYRRFVIFIP